MALLTTQRARLGIPAPTGGGPTQIQASTSPPLDSDDIADEIQLYLYSDPLGENSGPYVRLNDRFYRMPMARDLRSAAGGLVSFSEELPDASLTSVIHVYSDSNTDIAARRSRIYVKVNKAWVAVPMGYDLGGGVAEQLISTGSDLPTKDTRGLLYIYVDPEPDIALRRSRIYSKMNDGSWIPQLARFDFVEA